MSLKALKELRRNEKLYGSTCLTGVGVIVLILSIVSIVMPLVTEDHHQLTTFILSIVGIVIGFCACAVGVVYSCCPGEMCKRGNGKCSDYHRQRYIFPGGDAGNTGCEGHTVDVYKMPPRIAYDGRRHVIYHGSLLEYLNNLTESDFEDNKVKGRTITVQEIYNYRPIPEVDFKDDQGKTFTAHNQDNPEHCSDCWDKEEAESDYGF